jgi:predicted XRE-type DNA-binding protein
MHKFDHASTTTKDQLEDEPVITMRKSHFEAAIKGFRMEAKYRIATYFVMVEKLQQTDVARILGIKQSYISERIKIIQQRFKDYLEENDLEHSEIVFPKQMSDGLHIFEDSLLANEKSSFEDLDAISNAVRQTNSENISLVKEHVKDTKILAEDTDVHQLLAEIGIDDNDSDELEGAEKLLKLIALIGKSDQEAEAGSEAD